MLPPICITSVKLSAPLQALHCIPISIHSAECSLYLKYSAVSGAVQGARAQIGSAHCASRYSSFTMTMPFTALSMFNKAVRLGSQHLSAECFIEGPIMQSKSDGDCGKAVERNPSNWL